MCVKVDYSAAKGSLWRMIVRELRSESKKEGALISVLFDELTVVTIVVTIE